MDSDLVQVEFYFPKKGEVKSKEELANFIVEEMNKNGSMSYCGYADEKSFRNGINDYINDVDDLHYTPPSDDEKNDMREIIEATIKKCNDVLTLPTKNYVFVFPWSPSHKYEMFNGIIGVAPYSCVSHIFLSPKIWTRNGLANTVAHELNHTIYYSNHFDNFNNYTVLDELIMEGLAENFREQVVDSNLSPWSSALSEDDAFSLLDSISNKLDYKDPEFIQGLLFGNNEYKKWSGYSIGYWLIKRYLKENREFSWGDVMRKNSHEIHDSVVKNRV